MKRMCSGLATLVLALIVAPAQAAFHLFQIDQLYSNADGTVQYVMLVESSGQDGESFWQFHHLTSSIATFVFPSNLPSTATASRSVLVATQGFAARGLIAPDFTVPNGFLPIGGGMIDYAEGTNVVNFGALPTDGVTAIDRNGTHVPATPKNFAGATVTLTAAPATPDLNQHGLTGSWFKQATSGQGIEVEFFPNLVAPGTAFVQGAWFTFDTAPSGGADRQRWYTFDGPGVSGQTNVPVTIRQNLGGNFNAPPTTNALPVGSGTLSFADCDHAMFTYTFNDGTGRGGAIAMTRLLSNVTCTVGTAPTPSADFALSGNWFNAATSGQGFLVEVNPLRAQFFLAWYTYAPAGAMAPGASGQRWYTAQTGYTPGSRVIDADLFETTGGVFDQSLPAATTDSVGHATVTLGCAAAQVHFSFTKGSSAGQSGTIMLGRVSAMLPPGCATAASDDPMPMPPGMGYGPYGP